MPPRQRNRDQNPDDAQPVEVSPEQESAAKPVEVAPDQPATVENHDEEDVQAALQRSTKDGKGEGEVPPSDFDSFATEGVEKKDDLLSVELVADQVLMGKWGPNAEVAGERLRAAGYDVAAVAEEYEKRKAGGAPSAF